MSKEFSTMLRSWRQYEFQPLRKFQWLQINTFPGMDHGIDTTTRQHLIVKCVIEKKWSCSKPIRDYLHIQMHGFTCIVFGDIPEKCHPSAWILEKKSCMFCCDKVDGRRATRRLNQNNYKKFSRKNGAISRGEKCIYSKKGPSNRRSVKSEGKIMLVSRQEELLSKLQIL